jgi:CubicO group peptidase (beta-lactamase class C family)
MRRLAPILAAVLLVAACSSSDDGSSDSADATTASSEATTTTEAAETFVYPGEDWERADAAELGFDPAALEAVATTAEELDSTCFLVTRRGQIVGEWYWDGDDASTTHEVFSVTKSFTSTLVGMAQADGDLAIEDPASDYIDEWAGTDSEAVTIRNLLSNDSGREWSFGLDYAELPAAADRSQFAIDLDQQYPPGEAWSYNNAAIQTLDRVISEATGEVTADFAASRLFEPLGMDDTSMSADASGNSTNAFFGIQSTCEDLARFGYLFLREGAWDGEQIVPAEWVTDATGAPSQEHNAAYGYLWWLNTEGRLLSPLQAVTPTEEPEEVIGQIAPGAPEDMYTAQGLGGQIIMVDPGSETVVVRLGAGAAGDPTGGFRAQEASRVLTEALVE